MADFDRIQKLDAELKEYLSTHLNIYPSKSTYLEIMPNHTSKTSGIEFLCKEFGIQRRRLLL
jgi:hydroxymethylpyrimidine pyrophosphatase-like HAD family hydrolase